MQPQLKIEGWSALVTLDDACRFMSLNADQFRKLVEKWKVYPVAIEGSDEAVVWRLRDLDQLIKRLWVRHLRGCSPSTRFSLREENV